VGQRQAARALGVARRTVERRARWLAAHASAFQEEGLRQAVLTGPFQLDEMESFEANRYQPVTVPVLIDRKSLFIVATAVGPLRRKGRMTPLQMRRRAAGHETLWYFTREYVLTSMAAPPCATRTMPGRYGGPPGSAYRV
jgi:hypothetical protein